MAGWQDRQGLVMVWVSYPVRVSLSKLSFWGCHHAMSHTLLPLCRPVCGGIGPGRNVGQVVPIL